MPKMETPAGDLNIIIEKMTADDQHLITTAKLGAWEATVYFTPRETLGLTMKLLNPKVIGFIALMPIRLIKGFLAGNA